MLSPRKKWYIPKNNRLGGDRKMIRVNQPLIIMLSINQSKNSPERATHGIATEQKAGIKMIGSVVNQLFISYS
jgi:hypothetical protein